MPARAARSVASAPEPASAPPPAPPDVDIPMSRDPSGRSAGPTSTHDTQTLPPPPGPDAPLAERPPVLSEFELPANQLLQRLRTLPVTADHSDALWIPRRVHHQVSTILVTLMRAGTDAAAADWTWRGECAHLPRHVPQLLLRTLPGRQADRGECPADNATFTTALKKRIAHARANDWAQHYDDYEGELANATMTSRSRLHARSHEMDATCPQAAATRAKTGALRSAANILTSGPQVTPEPEATALIEQQLITAQRTPEDALLLADIVHVAAIIPAKHRARPCPRDIAHQLAHLKPAA